jgi:transcription-repair coupling factor (superfamily II helicase)
VARLAQERPQPTVVVVPGAAEVESWVADLRFFLGESEDMPPLERRVHGFPPWDTEPLSGVSPTGEVVAERLLTLYLLGQLSDPIVVTCPEALMQRLPSRRAVAARTRYLVEGEEAGFDGVVEALEEGGYQRVPQVEDRGEYSVRGGIVDVFPAGVAAPLRLQFDADVLDSIRTFDPATQCSLERRPDALLTPWREFSSARWRERRVRRAVEAYAQEREVDREERLLVLDRMEAGLGFPGAPFLLPFVEPSLETFGDWCPQAVRWILDGAAAVEAAEDAFARRVEEHARQAEAARRLVPPAEALYLSPDEVRRLRDGGPRIELDEIEVLEADDPDRGTLQVRSTLAGDVAVVPKTAGREASIQPLLDRLEDWARHGDRIVLVAHDRGQASRLQGLLEAHGLGFVRTDRPFPEAVEENRFAILTGALGAGFRLPEDRLAVVSGEEIFGERRRRQGRRVDVGRLLASLNELRPDDFVVHVDHGIGIYRGLRRLVVAGTEGDYLHLEYAGGDRLYVPVERIGLVQKYIGADGSAPTLDRLGGTSWERVKARARESVLAMARELLEVHAAREVLEGHAYGPPDESFREFEARFPFEETPDQERAIEEVLADLRRPRPMDRLVCGDVGFGKTEVALRAAFLVAMEGKQVAVLVPTTVLAQQHYETFRTRFEGFPVRIELLSRFRRPSETARVLEGLERGEVDIVIGTHRLLQDDVRWRDLGLLVIDEEHRFGVVDKERIKKLRKVVDVLTLTATPIPRTLQMALSGLRDLSIIESPPVDRQAIRTYVTRRDDSLIREACLRELARGGQVFFVHNRVETIDRVAEELRRIVPEARFGVAHGQMHGRSLEKVMLEFLARRIDVLVTTAIIESGLDIPNANTILIDRADQFGLAQLYQLRGRVGRSHQRAYAYLLIPGETLIGRDAQKRLEVLAALDELGGGFRLALHDLEIRGAGNLLGKQQSGQVAAVGFDLYTQMLEEAVRELRGETVRSEVEPEIQLGISAFVPDDYVADVNQRLALYKRLARASSPEELAELRMETEDRYGPLPARVVALFEIMDLRRDLKRARVLRLRRQGGRLLLRFHPDNDVDPQRLVALARSAAKRGLKILPDGDLSLPLSRIDLAGIAEEVRGLLRELGAEPAQAGSPGPSSVRSRG